MSDLDLHLAAIQAGDTGAFAKWVAAAEPVLRRSLHSFAASVDVEAVIQETLFRIWQAAGQHNPDGSANSLLRQAHRIARNLAIDETRRMTPEFVPPNELEARMPADDTEVHADPLLRRVLLKCLSALPERPATAIAARLRGAGTRDEDLAATVRMTAASFRQNIARARRALQTCLSNNGIDLEEHLR